MADIQPNINPVQAFMPPQAPRYPSGAGAAAASAARSRSAGQATSAVAGLAQTKMATESEERIAEERRKAAMAQQAMQTTGDVLQTGMRTKAIQAEGEADRAAKWKQLQAEQKHAREQNQDWMDYQDTQVRERRQWEALNKGFIDAADDPAIEAFGDVLQYHMGNLTNYRTNARMFAAMEAWNQREAQGPAAQATAELDRQMRERPEGKREPEKRRLRLDCGPSSSEDWPRRRGAPSRPGGNGVSRRAGRWSARPRDRFWPLRNRRVSARLPNWR